MISTGIFYKTNAYLAICQVFKQALLTLQKPGPQHNRMHILWEGAGIGDVEIHPEKGREGKMCARDWIQQRSYRCFSSFCLLPAVSSLPLITVVLVFSFYFFFFSHFLFGILGEPAGVLGEIVRL